MEGEPAGQGSEGVVPAVLRPEGLGGRCCVSPEKPTRRLHHLWSTGLAHIPDRGPSWAGVSRCAWDCQVKRSKTCVFKVMGLTRTSQTRLLLCGRNVSTPEPGAG